MGVPVATKSLQTHRAKSFNTLHDGFSGMASAAWKYQIANGLCWEKHYGHIFFIKEKSRGKNTCYWLFLERSTLSMLKDPGIGQGSRPSSSFSSNMGA
jgi:hypothetical protein